MIEHEWLVTIWCAPYSGGNEEQIGGGLQKYTVNAVGIDDAMNLANAIKTGIVSNPKVWLAEIVGVIQKKYAAVSNE
jgi:hypothetical protein